MLKRFQSDKGRQNFPSKRGRDWIARLDSMAGELNAFLLVFAIGLATLDLTCYWAFKLRNAVTLQNLPTTVAATGFAPAVVRPVAAANLSTGPAVRGW